MSKDADYRKLIHSARWLRLRRSVLSEKPLCEICNKEDYITASTEVHHKVPVETARTYREKETLMFDRNNLQSLCHACHVRVHMELGRSTKIDNIKRNKEKSKAFNERFFGA